jgi:subtilisin-like proprotein convertase family protein
MERPILPTLLRCGPLLLVGCAVVGEVPAEQAALAYFTDTDAISADADGDGYCAATQSCADATQPGDCDETDATIYPGAPESCDGIDSDCAGNGFRETLTPVDNTLVDAGSRTFTLDVTRDIPVQQLRVFVDMQHWRVGQVDVTLVSPAGTRVVLIDRRGGDRDHLDRVTFDDAAAGSISEAPLPFNGTWRPEEPLAAFDGESSAGTWSLEIVDHVALDSGRLWSWSLDFSLDEADVDGDGFFACDDCDDTNATVYPGAPELPDGLDNDCDGTFIDGDGDGFAEDRDCDDTNPAVNPGQTADLCNGFDEDCDGTVDEDCASNTVDYEGSS